MDLSVVIPVYNEEESIRELSEWIERVCMHNKLSFEIIFIDDEIGRASCRERVYI